MQGNEQPIISAFQLLSFSVFRFFYTLPPLAVRAIFERTEDFFSTFFGCSTWVERFRSVSSELTELWRAVKGSV